MESLEQRTLLSLSSATDETLKTGASTVGLIPVSGGSSSAGAVPVTSTSSQTTALQQSVADRNTIATVVAPLPTANNGSSPTTSHVYVGQPTSFMGPGGQSAPGTTGNLGQYNPNQTGGSGVPAAAAKAFPQYLVMPTTSQPPKGVMPLNFTGPAGYGPAQIKGAYGIVGDGAGQTIAVTDVGDYSALVNSTDPNFSSSALAVFDRQFGLPDPPSFTKYNELGQTGPLPSPNSGWFLEIALDVEWAHAIAPAANIALVEASNSTLGDLAHASYSAATVVNASVVSQSWGGYLEYNHDGAYEQQLDAQYYAPALAANPNLTFLAATGDGSARYGPIYPSISPLTVAVGGTSLDITGTTWEGESVWSGGGGGPSNTYPLPSYQDGVSGFDFGPLTTRTAPDISAVADPSTGVSVYEPIVYGGWVQVGGTSVATPITGGMMGIADADRAALGGSPLNGPNQTLPALYSSIDYTNNFRDIVSGNNFYQAGPGYDLGSGIGSPRAGGLLPTLALYQLGPAVTSSDPSAGQVVTTTPPTTFSLTFSEPIEQSSIVAADFTVDGTPADSASLSGDGLTITYTYNTSPVVTQGLETMTLPAGSVIGALDGHANAGTFTASFFYVQTQLQVSATSPPVGSVLTVPGNIDLVVQFNEAIDPYAVTTSDFQVSQGTVSSAVVLTPEAVDLTITGATQDGTLTLTVPAGVLLDSYGVPNLAFTGTYFTDIVSAPYPTPLQAQVPLGSLIYDPSVTGTVGFVGDTDTYTLALAAGQQLSLALTVDASLIGSVTVLAPGGATIGTATGSAAGAAVILQSLPITSSGTYSLVVSGSGGTTGGYSLQAILNAVFKTSSDSINSIGTAYDLGTAFESLGTTPTADRAGVIGTLGGTSGATFGPNAFGYSALAVTPTFTDISGTGTPTLTDTDDSTQHLDSSVLGSWSFQFYGNTYTSLDYSTNGLITFNGANNSYEHYDLSSYPPNPSIAPYWTDLENFSTGGSVYYQVVGTKLIIQWNDIAYYGSGGTPIDFEAVLDSSNNTIQYNYANLASGGSQDNGAYESVGIKNDNSFSGGADPLVVDYNSGPNAFVNSNLSTEIGVGLGIPNDYYAVAMTAGESATFALKDTTTGLTAGISLLDSSGNTLALGVSGGKSVDSVISDFVAQTTGTYYVEVSGMPSATYDLVVTRGSDFGLHGNSFAKAQPLNGAGVVLGDIGKSSGSFYVLDDQLYNTYNPIYPTDPTTGAFTGPSIPQPGSPLNNPFGLNLAFDGTNLYFNNGPDFGDNTIYVVDPSSGAVLNSFLPQEPYYLFGIAYFNGDLWATDSVNLYELDPTDGAVLAEFAGVFSSGNVTGLTADPDNGMLYAVSQFNVLYEIDPSTGAIVNSAPDNAQGLNEQDMAYADGLLIVSDTNGLASAGGTNVLDEYDPTTLAFVARVPVAVQGFVSGLGGDGLGGSSADWYSFNVNAGDNLVITTTTPGATSASGLQFPNDLDPTINLYDASGNLVATATGNASDGRNDVIDYTALSGGSYRVQILGANKTNIGEYTISVQGDTGGLAPMTVTSTTPAAGSDLGYQVSSMDVSFSSNVLLSSVSDSDFTIDGNNATGYSVDGPSTVTFFFATTADGVHNVTISGVENLQGTVVTPDSFSFQTDDVPPYVVSSSIADGAVLSPGPLTEVITFSKPIQPGSASASDIELFGEVRGVEYAPSSITFDPTDTIMTITYSSLPNDAYQFELVAGASNFLSVAGVPLQSNFVINFTMPVGTTTITGLNAVLPLGSLVYDPPIDGILLSSSDVATYDLTIDPKQTLSVIGIPVSSGMTMTITLISPTGHVIGTATSSSPGATVLLPVVQSSAGGTYEIQVTGGPGEYTVQAVLNALVDPAAYGGTPNSSIATATPIDPYANKFAGNDDRTAVLGGLSGGGGGSGGLVSTDRATQALYSVDSSTGASTYIGSLTYFTSFSGMAIDPNSGTTYISDLFNSSTGLWSLGTIDRTTGQETIIGAQYDPTFNEYDSDIHALVDVKGTVYGFSYTRGIGTMNTSNGEFTPLLSYDSMPEPIENAAIDPTTGTVYGIGEFTADIYTINVSTAAATFVGNSGTGFFDLMGLAFTGGTLYSLGYQGYSTNNPLYQIDPTTGAGTYIGPNGMEYEPDAMTAPPGGGGGSGESSATYSFALSQGESATVVIESLNTKNVQFSLLDDNGDVLGVSSPGATNYTAGLNNFVAPADGTYYVSVTGDPGVKFNLVVTRGADFITKPNNTPATAQDITATELSGDNKLGGVLGYLANPSGPQVGTSFEGASGTDANNNCGCLPPDTNAAVGGNWVVEAVNTELVIFDKATGTELFSETLDSLYSPLGQQSEGDVYVVYDQIADRWYVDSIDLNNEADLLFAISNDANPLDGFSTQYVVPLASPGDLSDFPKFGYNYDYITLSANDFGDGNAKVTVLNKADALAGTLSYVQLQPSPQFRALVPAQDATAQPGDPIWFVGAPYLNQGETNNVIRVTELQDPFGAGTLTDYFVPVDTYGGYTAYVDQPGGPGTVAANDNTTTQVFDYNGTLVTAIPASTAADGYLYPKVHYYEIDVSSGTPVLSLQGVIDPGTGVAAFFPTVAINPNTGDLGLTWMQSSSTEYVSMYVGTVSAATGNVGVTDAAPGVTTEADSFRNGDYSSVVYDPGTDAFWAANEYAGVNNASEIWNTWISEFAPSAGVGTDYYSVNANAGDNLAFSTTTPAGGPAEFVNNFYPELLLYDPNGNLVAVAAGNAPDGRNSVIDFTVPSGDAGKWVIEVTPSPNTPLPTAGEYGLLATGATGALSSFVVTSTTPAAGALIQPPTDIVVTFDSSIYLPSLTAGELEVNGVAATGFTLVSANTVDWSIPSSAFGTGIDLPNVVTIGADALGNQVMDVSGATLTPYSYTFFTTNVAPYIVSSSIDGQVFSPAPADVTEIVTFSQPMNTTFTTASSFSLYGNYLGVSYAAASFSWDPTGTILTINYDNLPNDAYTLTLFASGFESVVGLPLGSDYVASFSVALGTAAFTTPFTPVKPLGDLIYTSTDDPVLVTPTDIDYLTLALNAGETLTLVATPTTPTLQLWLTILDPSSNVVAYTEASAPGAAAVIETAALATTGTYTIVVYDVNGNIGQYSIQATLNATVKTGSSNSTIANAIDISGSSYALTPGSADRLGVVGSLPTDVVSVGDVYVSSRYYGYYYPAQTISDILRVNTSGQIVQVIPVEGDPYLSLSGVELDPVNNMLYAAVTTNFGTSSVSGELLEFDPITGQQVATIPLPDDNAESYYYYPYGFSIAPDGTFWLPQPNSGNIIHTDASGNELGSYSAGGYMPESASIGADGNVYFSTSIGNVYQLVPSSGAVNFFASTASPFGTLTNTAPGGTGIWAADYYEGGVRYDYNGNFQQQVSTFYEGTNQVQTDENGDVWDANTNYWDVFKFDATDNFLGATFVPVPIGLTIWGVDNPNPPAQDTQDYYSFDLTAGQTATVVTDSLNGKSVEISIVDGDGNVLATGVTGATNVSASIKNFVAPSTGTYYVEVTGDPGLQYSVAVTRGATFSLQAHNSSSTAEDVTGNGGVLGYLAPPTGALYVLDDQLYNAFNPIYPTDPTTGAFTGPGIAQPGSPLNNPFGLNLAYDGTNLYFNNGPDFGDNTIYVVNPSTGAVLNSYLPQEPYYLFGIAYYNGDLWATDSVNLYELNPTNGAVLQEFSGVFPTGNVTGLTADPADGMLYAVSQFNELYEIDPTTGVIVNSAPDNAQGLNEQDMAFAGGLLIVSDTNGLATSGGTNVLDEYDPTTLAFVARVPVPVEGFVSGLGGDGIGGGAKDDWYSVNVEAGQSLVLTTSTPSDQGGQFPNSASMEVYLYDTFGNLVATGTKESDGRNVTLSFNAPISGQYKIQVVEDAGGAGEYYLSVNTPTYPSGGISGDVYNDLNGSGSFVAGDPGLAGWEVDLYNSNGVFVASQLTDANGNYDFEGLDPGTYTVVEVVQAGWTQTAPPPPGTFTETVVAGSTISGLQFGNFQDITISGEKFNDLNGDGMQEPGEPGLAGWTIDLFDSSGDLIATTVTDANGDYSFSDIGPGTYTVGEELQPGWVQTDPGGAGTYTVAATSGQDVGGLLFGNFQSVTYTGTVYNDLNGNGVDDAGDPGLQGWTVELLDSSGNIVASTTSAADGSYSFADVAPGSYTIEEVNQSGWYQTQPSHPYVYTVTATSGASQSGLNFGNFQLVNVTGNVYNDLNANGHKDPGEPGLQGWTVLLEDASGNVAATTTSDANGNYEFDSLFPATFIIVEVPQSGWTQTQPLNPNYYEFATQSGLNLTGLNFGNYYKFTPITVTGNVYNDLNGSGHKSPIDPNLSGWTVELLNSAGAVVATTLSNLHGNFTFSGVSVGTYEVEEIVQSGWVQTQPVSPPYYTFTSQSGVNVSNLFFGNHHIAATHSAVVNNGSSGSSGVAIGTVPPVTTTTGKTTTVAINGKSGSSNNAVTVIYSSSPPAQGAPTASSIIDLALSDNGKTGTTVSSDSIGLLAADILSTKKTRA